MVGTAYASDRIKLMENTDASGKTTYFMVDEGVLKKCPGWDLRIAPPLSAAEAIAKAKKWLKQEDADVTAVHLNKVGGPPVLEDKWVYSLSLQGRVNGFPADKFFFVVILMDGTVVQPSEKAK